MRATSSRSARAAAGSDVSRPRARRLTASTRDSAAPSTARRLPDASSRSRAAAAAANCARVACSSRTKPDSRVSAYIDRPTVIVAITQKDTSSADQPW